MPPEPRQVSVSPQPDAAKRRLHIHGIKEMPAGYDAEVAELFRDLRAASALSETDLAARLGTRVDVVQALEQGALYALPPWAETCRVVNAYGALLNLDVRPLLRRIYAQLEAGIVELRPKAMPDVPVMTPPENSDFAFQRDKPAAPTGPSPLDIQWTPDPLPTRPQNPPPPAPRAPSPQAPWPNAAPSPQAWPGGPSSLPPQAPWPNAAPQRPPAPQPQQPDRRGPPRPMQAQPQQRPSQPQQPPAPARQPAQPQPAQPQPPQPRAEFSPAPASPAAAPAPSEEKPRRKPALLKWGIVALLISIMAFGVWMVLGNSTGPSGAKAPGAGGSQVLDPDDPRSRKADRLPSPF
jgi:hypothetical protein